jgi:hypothetical protein
VQDFAQATKARHLKVIDHWYRGKQGERPQMWKTSSLRPEARKPCPGLARIPQRPPHGVT